MEPNHEAKGMRDPHHRARLAWGPCLKVVIAGQRLDGFIQSIIMQDLVRNLLPNKALQRRGRSVDLGGWDDRRGRRRRST